MPERKNLVQNKENTLYLYKTMYYNNKYINKTENACSIELQDLNSAIAIKANPTPHY